MVKSNSSSKVFLTWVLSGIIAKILSLTDQAIDYEMAKINSTLKNYSEADSIYKKLIRDKKVSNEIIYR